jgi:hypothetical protein
MEGTAMKMTVDELKAEQGSQTKPGSFRRLLRNMRKAKGRNLPGHRKGVMNKTEEKWSKEVLEPLKASGKVLHSEFEAMTFRLAKLTGWTPDFMLLYADGLIEFVDVKGTQANDEQAQRVKVKLAAEKFWMFQFVVAKQRTKKYGGGFGREVF